MPLAAERLRDMGLLLDTNREVIYGSSATSLDLTLSDIEAQNQGHSHLKDYIP